MAVLKQTSPTAWPSAPKPKPSSTVPSASTRSAVGLWSGQAASFSDCVMSPLHSPGKVRRQSRKWRIHMRFRRVSIPSQEPDHQDLVEIAIPVLQGLHFAAIFGKSRFSIEPDGRLVVAGDAELKLLHAATGMIDDRRDQALTEAGAARGLADVHAPKPGLVAHLGALLRPVASNAEQLASVKGAEHMAFDDPLREPVERHGAFAFEGRGERLGVALQSLQADVAIGNGVGGRERSDARRGRHVQGTRLFLGPERPRSNGLDHLKA